VNYSITPAHVAVLLQALAARAPRPTYARTTAGFLVAADFTFSKFTTNLTSKSRWRDCQTGGWGKYFFAEPPFIYDCLIWQSVIG